MLSASQKLHKVNPEKSFKKRDFWINIKVQLYPRDRHSPLSPQTMHTDVHTQNSVAEMAEHKGVYL